jgi:hypothetical protein
MLLALFHFPSKHVKSPRECQIDGHSTTFDATCHATYQFPLTYDGFSSALHTINPTGFYAQQHLDHCIFRKHDSDNSTTPSGSMTVSTALLLLEV